MRKEDFHEICDATVGELEPLIARTTRDQAGYGTFIANLASNPKAFVQFTSSGPHVRFDFPLITPEQRAQAELILAAAAEMGLPAKKRGVFRTKEIQVDVDGQPSRIASVLARFLERLHGATAAERLRIEYFGFDAA